MSNYEKGMTVKFGHYYQNNLQEKEAIEWLILDKREDAYLLISKNILDARAYNDTLNDVTWEICTLRTWLNMDFYMEAFDSSERRFICETVNPNKDNTAPLRMSMFGLTSGRTNVVSGGNTTKDKVFLLSWDEYDKYFKRDTNSASLIKLVEVQVAMFHPSDMNQVARAYIGIDAPATEYAKSRGLDSTNSIWLRSPGNTSQMAVNTMLGKVLYRPGCEVNDATNAVRPSLWVKKDAFLTEEERTEKQRLDNERRRKENEERQRLLWKSNNQCQYCGGKFKGLFSKTCATCGRKKDY